MQSLKIQFKDGKDTFSISTVNGKTTYWVLKHNKNLGRKVASKVTDEKVTKKLEGVYNKIVKAVS